MTRATDDHHAAVAARLHGAGQRYTQSRRALVEILVRAGRPLSTAEIVSRAPRLPQSSVYRNLAVLEQAATARRVAASDGVARFELAEDLTEHHHHLVCTGCGSVADYVLPPGVERSVRRMMEAVASGTGFLPDGHRLDLVGLCADCR